MIFFREGTMLSLRDGLRTDGLYHKDGKVIWSAP